MVTRDHWLLDTGYWINHNGYIMMAVNVEHDGND